jgi:putative membrane protein insertion efficiency factor
MCQHQHHQPQTNYTWLFKAYRALKPFWFQPLAGTCRFVPSCSQYAEAVLADFGFWRGTWLALKRLTRCHPFSQTPVGTVDAPPTR